MKTAVVVAILSFLFLFTLTTFSSSASYQEIALQEGFSNSEIDAHWRLSLQRKLIFWTNTFLTIGFFSWLVLSGRTRRLTDWIDARTGKRWWLTLPVLAIICFVCERILLFPMQILSLEHWRAWGMTERPLQSWLMDYGKATAISAVIGGLLLMALYLLMHWLPRWWWFVATVGAGAFGVALAYLMPIFIDPLFNTFTPLATYQQQHQLPKQAANVIGLTSGHALLAAAILPPVPSLEEKIFSLADSANIPVQEILVMDASRQGNHTNAYFTGFGSTRRIVLYDTLLKNHPDAEIESIMAHEIGHWIHGHIVIGISLGVAGSLLGFYLLHCILQWAVNRPPFQLRHPADPAGWPLIILLSMLGLWLARPVENAISRHFERQADTTSLELAGKADVFIDAERRLVRDNKSNLVPSQFSVWMFSTHPPALERIRMARQWRDKFDRKEE